MTVPNQASTGTSGTQSCRARTPRFPGEYAQRTPDRAAIIFDGSSMTYAELDAAANRAAHMLRAAGAGWGDHVVIALENSAQMLAIVWGCHYAGLVYTTCSPRSTTRELAHVVNDSRARFVFLSARLSEVGTELLANTPAVTARYSVGGELPGYLSYEQVVAGFPTSPEQDPRVAGADMLYSSGTTGLPKGIERPFIERPLETSPVGVSVVAHRLYTFTADTVYLCPAPLYHGAGLRFCLAANALGATVVLMPSFDTVEFLALVQRYKVTHTQLVPTMFVRLLQLPVEVRTGYDVSSLRFVLHAAAPCPVPVKRQIIEWLGPIVFEYYAGTESNGMTFCSSQEWSAHEGTVGRPVDCEVHICDDQGTELPTGETGLVYFGGGPEFAYHGDKTKTSASRHPRGWSTLGDVGRLDADGYLYLTDRKAFMIISGGVNIYPQEIEDVLGEHPAVRDAAVFGVPNPDFGEEVRALVVVGPDDIDVDVDELARFCRSRLAPYKCPKRIELVGDLPRDAAGKLRKKEIRDAYLSANS